jgi:hypothetical protein
MMRIRTLKATVVCSLVVAGCGQSSATRKLSADGVPLVGGARVVARAHSCDHGAHPYCALQLVIVGSGFRSSNDFLISEESRLRKLGWTSTVGDTPKERSADSPGHRLRLSLGIAPDDLISWDQGQIKRRAGIARALARTMFQQQPALSLMLQTGSS